MRKVASLILLLLLLSRIAAAAQVYGNLKEANRSVGGGVELSITCGQASPLKVITDAYGSYNVFLPSSGKCLLTVLYQGRESQPHPIFSSDDPTRYDFDLLRQGNGSLVLKRR